MSFDRLAKYYSSLEWLLAGRKLQQCRTALLAEALNARSILLVGEGHGKFLAELCSANSQGVIYYLDASAEMARVAKNRLASLALPNPVHFHTGPILEFATAERFDLIVTHFFLDCFQREELTRIIEKLNGLLDPGGHWIIADFQVPPDGWRRLRSQAILFLAYRFFRVATRLPAARLESPQQHLRAHRLRLQKRTEFSFGLLYSEFWEKPSVATA